MFVVFEGIDGSGKTTVSNRVVKELTDRGLRVKHVRAEGKFASAVTEGIRALARDVKNVELVPKAEFLLYVAREVQLVEEALVPALSSHDVVIADRFLYTAEILARFGRRLSPDYIEAILGAPLRELVPDLVVLVDVDPALARARRRAGKVGTVDLRPPSRKGLAGTGLQQRLREGYARKAASEPERWAVVDNDQQLDVTVGRVARLIEASMQRGVWRTLVDFRAEAGARAHGATEEGALLGTAEALDAFLGWLTRRAETEPGVAAQLLAGFWGPAVDGLREALAARVPQVVLSSLRGLGDETSFRLRRALLERYPGPVAESVAGLPNTEARALELRLELAERAGREVARSTGSLADEHSFSLREQLYEREPDAVMGSLATLETPRAWELRERWLGKRKSELGGSYELSRVAARSIKGLSDERAWSLRGLVREAAPIEALRSIVGLGDDKSFEWRSRAIHRAPKPVMESLRGVDAPWAWEMRRRVAADCREALEGISGVDREDAWHLRELYADVWPCAVVKSLGSLCSAERGRALLARQLRQHGGSLNVQRHAAAIALGLNEDSTLAENE